LESFLESQGVPQIPVKAKKVPGDFLGNAARWWVKAASSPYLGTLVKLTFFFMFFISFLESTPLVGKVVSVALDAVLAGGRILVKALQKGIPAMIGLIPLPYSQLGGVALVSVIGMFVWTILATISFGRQDFTSAIDSMLRIIPVPIGDALADSFLDVNRTIDQFNDKRVQLTDDVWNGMLLLQQVLAGISATVQSTAGDALARVKSGANMLLDAIRGVREAPPVPEPVPVAAPFATPVPVATPVEAPPPVAQPPAEAPIPTAPPVEAPPVLPTAPPVEAPPPVPVPTAPPVEAPAPIPEPAPVPPPVPTAPPVAPPAPTFEAGPPPAQSALERLRSGQSVNRAIDVGRGFRGGKSLSGKRRTRRKWTHPLYERFYGLGLR
jgi:outer membrane biosynthesis protein TonB